MTTPASAVRTYWLPSAARSFTQGSTAETTCAPGRVRSPLQAAAASAAAGGRRQRRCGRPLAARSGRRGARAPPPPAAPPPP